MKCSMNLTKNRPCNHILLQNTIAYTVVIHKNVFIIKIAKITVKARTVVTFSYFGGNYGCHGHFVIFK